MSDSARTEQVKTWIVFAAFGLAMIALVFVINARFNAGKARRHDICTQINSVKKILHDEHVPKLHTAAENVLKYPHGVTLQTKEGPVEVTHQDLLDTRTLEQRIVRETSREDCP